MPFPAGGNPPNVAQPVPQRVPPEACFITDAACPAPPRIRTSDALPRLPRPQGLRPDAALRFLPARRGCSWSSCRDPPPWAGRVTARHLPLFDSLEPDVARPTVCCVEPDHLSAVATNESQIDDRERAGERVSLRVGENHRVAGSTSRTGWTTGESPI